MIAPFESYFDSSQGHLKGDIKIRTQITVQQVLPAHQFESNQGHLDEIVKIEILDYSSAWLNVDRWSLVDSLYQASILTAETSNCVGWWRISDPLHLASNHTIQSDFCVQDTVWRLMQEMYKKLKPMMVTLGANMDANQVRKAEEAMYRLHFPCLHEPIFGKSVRTECELNPVQATSGLCA